MASRSSPFKARLPINIIPSPRASRTNLTLEPPTAEIMDSINDLEGSKEELYRQCELERQGRIAAEARIQELLAQTRQQNEQLSYLGNTIDDLRDSLVNNSANALLSASTRSAKAASERSSIAGAQDSWTEASDAVHPLDAESQISVSVAEPQTLNTDHQERETTDASVTKAAFQNHRMKTLEDKLRRNQHLHFQSQKQIERLEEQVSQLETDNKQLLKQLKNYNKIQTMTKGSKMGPGTTASAQSHRQTGPTSRPKRPAFDKDVPGGVPDWAKGSFIYNDRQSNHHEILLKAHLHRSAVLLEGPPPSLAKALVAVFAASEQALALKNMALLGRCALGRAKVEYELEAYHEAVRSFKEARACKGRYIEGQDLSKWITRSERKAALRAQGRLDTAQDETLEDAAEPSPGLTRDERDNIKISMSRWTEDREKIRSAEFWLSIFEDASKAAHFANELDNALRSSQVSRPSDMLKTLELDSPGIMLDSTEVKAPDTDEVVQRNTQLRVDVTSPDLSQIKDSDAGPVSSSITRKHKPVPIETNPPSSGAKVQFAGTAESTDSTPRRIDDRPRLEDGTNESTVTPKHFRPVAGPVPSSRPSTATRIDPGVEDTKPTFLDSATTSSDRSKEEIPTPRFTMETLRASPIRPGTSSASRLWGLGNVFSAVSSSAEPASAASTSAQSADATEPSRRRRLTLETKNLPPAGEPQSGQTSIEDTPMLSASSLGSPNMDDLSRVTTHEDYEDVVGPSGPAKGALEKISEPRIHDYQSPIVGYTAEDELNDRSYHHAPSDRGPNLSYAAAEAVTNTKNRPSASQSPEASQPNDLYSPPSPPLHSPAPQHNPRHQPANSNSSDSTPSPPSTPPQLARDDIRRWLNTQARNFRRYENPNSSTNARRLRHAHLPGFDEMFAEERQRPRTAGIDGGPPYPLSRSGRGHGLGINMDGAGDERPQTSRGEYEPGSAYTYSPPEMSPRLPPLPRSAGLEMPRAFGGSRQSHRRQSSSIIEMLRGLVSPLRRGTEPGAAGDEEAVVGEDGSSSDGIHEVGVEEGEYQGRKEDQAEVEDEDVKKRRLLEEGREGTADEADARMQEGTVPMVKVPFQARTGDHR